MQSQETIKPGGLLSSARLDAWFWMWRAIGILYRCEGVHWRKRVRLLGRFVGAWLFGGQAPDSACFTLQCWGYLELAGRREAEAK
jgi:hypothetical protein